MDSNKRGSNKTSRRLTIIPLVAVFILLPGLIFVCFKLLSETSPKMVNRYEELMVNAGIRKDVKNPSSYLVKQERFKIEKQLLFTENEQRMELKLLAQDSQIILDHYDDKTKVIEQMNDIVCSMQEELYYILPDGREACYSKEGKLLVRGQDPNNLSSYVAKGAILIPMQTIRLMWADKGLYDYKSDLFFADHVKIERFTASGHHLTDTLDLKKKLMSGIADSVEFSLDGKKMNFKANKLKAILNAGSK